MFGVISCWYFETCNLVLLSFGFELSTPVIVNSEVGGLGAVTKTCFSNVVCIFGKYWVKNCVDMHVLLFKKIENMCLNTRNKRTSNFRRFWKLKVIPKYSQL